MIRVEIDLSEVPKWAQTNDTGAFSCYVASKLSIAGIPIVGSPLLPRVDFTKGTLLTWHDYENDRNIYLWK